MSTIIWEQLSDEQKDWITSAAKESVSVQRKHWAASELESLNAVRKAGIEVIEPDLLSFQNATSQIIEDFKMDDQLRPIINQIIQAGENTN